MGMKLHHKILIIGSSSEISKKFVEEIGHDENVEIFSSLSSKNLDKDVYIRKVIESAKIFFKKNPYDSAEVKQSIIFFNGMIDMQLPHNLIESDTRFLYDVNLFTPVFLTKKLMSAIPGRVNFAFLGSSVATKSGTPSVYYASAKSALFTFAKNMNFLYARTGKLFYFYDLGFVGIGINNLVDKETNQNVLHRSSVKEFVSIKDFASCVISTLGNKSLSGSRISVDNGYS